MSSRMKREEKNETKKAAFEAYYNGNLPAEEIARRAGTSPRTIYRYLRAVKAGLDPAVVPKKTRPGRPRLYQAPIFARALELKTEIPQRSAIIVRKILLKEFRPPVPAISTLRAFLHDHNPTSAGKAMHKGYVVFERAQPNDLWQVDIAGVQYYGPVGGVYLIALLDDCSRFIVAAQFYPDQQVKWVIDVIRQAVEKYGRPNQVLADNGAQFKGMVRGQESTYELVLKDLGIEPIYARAHHPQTKGKLERWFGTVLRQFYPEALAHVNAHGGTNLTQLNQLLAEWVEWYNTQKSHRSLPGRTTPAGVFCEKQPRVYRPLEAPVNWGRYLGHRTRRKVRKTNLVQYCQHTYPIPAGHAGKLVDLCEYGGHLRVFSENTLLVEHVLQDALPLEEILQTHTRVVSQSGTFKFRKNTLYVGQKLAGKTVSVKVDEEEGRALVYIDQILVKTFDLTP
jgi:transposase InsO family protein